MAHKQSRSQSSLPESETGGMAESQMHQPQKGEHYRCETCGMELDVTTSCDCHTEDGAHFECCGQELSRV